MTVKEFLKSAFKDMKEGAKAQHEVDKANFAAAKAESKVNWEKAKTMGDPERRKNVMKSEREAQIALAKKRQAEAESHINSAKETI